MSDVISRMKKILSDENISLKQLTEEFEIANSSFTDWKNAKGGYPPITVLIKFSERFNVSLDYLVFGNEPEREFPVGKNNVMEISSPADELLLIKFHSLPAGKQIRLLGYIDGMLDAIKNKDEVQ